MTSLTSEETRFILECGILAPSADNQHRLRFQIKDGTLSIWWSGDYALPSLGGYKRILALLSLGALSENLTVAANRFGVQTDLTLVADDAQPGLVARVHWRRDTSPAGTCTLWETIHARHTNRHVFYRGPRLSAADRATLDHPVSARAGCHITWLDEPRARRQAIRLMRAAEAERFRNPLLHEELFSPIRFDVGWNRSCGDGLPPGALSIERPLRPLFALLRHWPIMKVVSMLGGHHVLGWRAAGLPAKFCPHLGVIAADMASDEAAVVAGSAFQRLWLGVARLGYSLQPMPASALYSLEGATAEGIPSALQQQLRNGWRTILACSQQPLMLFRIGRAPAPPVRTGRLPLESFLSEIA